MKPSVKPSVKNDADGFLYMVMGKYNILRAAMKVCDCNGIRCSRAKNELTNYFVRIVCWIYKKLKSSKIAAWKVAV